MIKKALFVAAVLLNAPAFAGGYVGLSIGQSSYEEDLSSIGSSDFEGTDSAYKVFAGYRLSPSVAIEGIYADYGEPEDTILGLDASVEIKGFGAYIVGIAPLNADLEVFGKVGMFSWDATANVSDGVSSASVDDDGTDIAYGVGATYSINDHVGIRAEWEAINVDSDADLSMWTVGAEYRF
ncbi:MAG: porin family protein [Candidatus Polarisedimenticolaceae bacterium]|nr:porin family protein [Candidatus Polarisedimenticolaceae bacterium]